MSPKGSAQGVASLEAARIDVSKYEIRYLFFKHVVTAAAWVAGVALTLHGLQPIIIYGKAAEINAAANFIASLRPGSVIGYILFIVMFALYRIERSGKKRAIKEKAKWQKLAESQEPNRTSSHLTDTGETPNGRSGHE